MQQISVLKYIFVSDGDLRFIVYLQRSSYNPELFKFQASINRLCVIFIFKAARKVMSLRYNVIARLHLWQINCFVGINGSHSSKMSALFQHTGIKRGGNHMHRNKEGEWNRWRM